MPSGQKFSWFWVFLITLMLVLMSSWVQTEKTIETVPYSQFLSYLDQGQVVEVSISPEKVVGVLKNAPEGKPRRFSTIRVEDPDLVQKLERAEVKFTGMRESNLLGGILSWVIPLLFLYFIFSFFLRRAGGGLPKGGGMLPFGKSKAKIYVETGLKTNFDDVAGVDEAKEELREIVNFLKDPKSYSKLGGHMPKGALLVGPPGTGKTLLARAVAGEANVPFFSINGSEFVELFVGLGAARVRDLFEQARGKAPCIIFIDELDALGKARGLNAISGSANDEKEQTLNQLLAEMDGFDPSTGIIVLAATNRPEVLDPALMRAGRFDRQVLVDKPDRKGREMILGIHLKNIKMSAEVSIADIASMTAGFSGADLANLANEAALIATRKKRERVEKQDFTEAVERVIAGVERKSRLLGPEERKRVAYHEMGHATVALALGKGEVVHKVSIIPRGIAALGYTIRRPTEDRYLVGRHELETKIAVALGGRAAEMTFFDDISTGAGDDLDKATEIAKAMVTRYGMEPSLGLAVLDRDTAPMLGNHMGNRVGGYSEKTAQQVDQAIKNLLDQSMGTALSVVTSNRDFIDRAVEILILKETMDESALRELWEKHHEVRLKAV